MDVFFILVKEFGIILENMGYKNTYLNNSELLFNLKILCFIPLEEVEDFYNKIKKNLKIININNSLPILIVHG